MTNTNYLLISLGHNSSALFYNPSTGKVIGYEQERLDAIKSSSKFPRDAVNEILKNVSPEEIKGCKIKISHWFDFSNAKLGNSLVISKYLTQNDYDFLNSISDGNDIEICNPKFTHHDAHAYSALGFFNFYSQKEDKPVNGDLHTLVCDGFGNNEEVISLYKMSADGKKQDLVFRVNDYMASLGLFYQYATSFVGMKENQDEYKFLGYEAHIDECFNSKEIDKINEFVNYYLSDYKNRVFHNTNKFSCTSELINFGKLAEVKRDVYKNLKSACDSLDLAVYTDFKARALVGYVAQALVEGVVKSILEKFNVKNVSLAGGTFYNVKLNKKVLDTEIGRASCRERV